MPQLICETNRLILRLPTLDDVEDSFAIYCDPEVMKYIDGDEPFESVDVARKSIEAGLRHYEQHGICHFSVELKDTGAMIGHCGFNIFEDTTDWELVIHINRKFWRQGYASEAGQAVVKFAERQAKTERIIAVVDEKNIGSVKIIEQLGLSFVAKQDFDGYLLSVYQRRLK